MTELTRRRSSPIEQASLRSGTSFSVPRKALAARNRSPSAIESVVPNANEYDAKDDKESKEQVDDVQGKPPPTRKQKVKRHVRRCWCCYALLIFLIIFLPILFTVIIPAIVQRIVNNLNIWSIGLESANLTNPQPSSIAFSVKTQKLPVPGGISIGVSSMELQVYNPNETRSKTDFNPFVKMSLPSIHMKGSQALTLSNVTIHFVNETVLLKLFNATVNGSKASVAVHAKTTLTAIGLKIPLKIDKAVSLPELDLAGFNNYSISSLSIMVPAASDGSNFAVNVTFPNPTAFGAQLGNISIDALIGGVTLGTIICEDLALTSGNNTIAIRGEINLGWAVGNITTIIGQEIGPLMGGNVSVEVKGNSATYNGLHITWLEDVLRNFDIKTEMKISDLLSKLGIGL